MSRYKDVYDRGVEQLEGFADAALDARLLLEHVCATDVQTLLAEPEREVSEEEERTFLSLIARRAAHEPLAYIVGEQEFMGLPFVVTPDVLIPEQDTEILVEEAMRQMEDNSRILDLCTGSGCILLSLLHYSNGCTGVGTDLSEAALAVAGRNAEALGLAGQCTWLSGDLFSALEGAEGIPQRYDLIVSNPPYIPAAVIETLAEEVQGHEPRMALDGGADGLDFYRRIIGEAQRHLVIGGRVMLEIGYDQGERVPALLREAGFIEVEVYRDYGGNDRVVSAVRSIHQKG